LATTKILNKKIKINWYLLNKKCQFIFLILIETIH
jgi:hypothetical protein